MSKTEILDIELAALLVVEADNLGPMGMWNVGSVVLNRHKSKDAQFGANFSSNLSSNLRNIIYKEYELPKFNKKIAQFSAINTHRFKKLIKEPKSRGKNFQYVLKNIVPRIKDGTLKDLTGGALWYYNPPASGKTGSNWFKKALAAGDIVPTITDFKDGNTQHQFFTLAGNKQNHPGLKPYNFKLFNETLLSISRNTPIDMSNHPDKIKQQYIDSLTWPPSPSVEYPHGLKVSEPIVSPPSPSVEYPHGLKDKKPLKEVPKKLKPLTFEGWGGLSPTNPPLNTSFNLDDSWGGGYQMSSFDRFLRDSNILKKGKPEITSSSSVFDRFISDVQNMLGNK